MDRIYKWIHVRLTNLWVTETLKLREKIVMKERKAIYEDVKQKKR